MKPTFPRALMVAVLGVACSDPNRDESPFGSGAGDSTTGGGDGGSEGNDGTDDEDGGNGGTSGDGVLFDVGGGTDGGLGDESDDGCKKIDFLFVVDNSVSMMDEQINLANSFPGFMAAIESTLQAQDYHVMVVDTDEGARDDCETLCMYTDECNGIPCNMLPPPPSGCDVALGAGITTTPEGADCGVTGGNRYMVDGQPDLSGTFECAALVGIMGSSNERPMEAMLDAVTVHNGAGRCNEAFLRDDAILVVTFITDEEEEGSPGTPSAWAQGLVDAKQGNADAVVVLGLFGNPAGPAVQCEPGSDRGGEPSPRLEDFVSRFPHGVAGGVCEPDYAPFFVDAVSVIDTACDEFVPPG